MQQVLHSHTFSTRCYREISAFSPHTKLYHMQPSPTNMAGSAATSCDQCDCACESLPTFCSGLVCVGVGALNAIKDPAYAHSILQRDAELLPLYIAVQQASNEAQAQHASAALQQALAARSSVDQAVRHTVSILLSLPEVINLLQVSMHMLDTLSTCVVLQVGMHEQQAP